MTKGPLILRDLDVLKQIPDLDVHMSIATLDAAVARQLEPGTPPPAARMEAVRRLNAAGIRTGVFMAPILPGLTDSEATLRAVAEAAADAGAPYVVPVTLRLAPEVREWFLPFISRHFPQLTRQYCRFYQETEAPVEYKRATLGLAARLIHDLGLETKINSPKPQAPEQLRLSI
ncbi:MAG TPA: radical SAM protein [Symbiobacteriaceae bacterium]|nr:radical SAM protein [Symbiobacteriaceae bacterium]